jgi:hypothetical protein
LLNGNPGTNSGGYGFVSFKTAEGAQKAKVEASNFMFKGKALSICQFETKVVRQAHNAEKFDQL